MVEALSVNRRLVADDIPRFSVRKRILLREYGVIIVWPDGRRQKFGKFQSRQDAARWIEQDSANWLLEHHQANNKISLEA